MERMNFNSIEDVATYINMLEAENERLTAENERLNIQHNEDVVKLINDNIEISRGIRQNEENLNSLTNRVLEVETNQKSILEIGADKIEKAVEEYESNSYYKLKDIFAEMDIQLLINNLRDVHAAYYHRRSLQLIADELERRLNLK